MVLAITELPTVIAFQTMHTSVDHVASSKLPSLVAQNCTISANLGPCLLKDTASLQEKTLKNYD